MKSLYCQLFKLISNRSKNKMMLLVDSKNEIVRSYEIKINSSTIAKQRNSKNGVFIKNERRIGKRRYMEIDS